MLYKYHNQEFLDKGKPEYIITSFCRGMALQERFLECTIQELGVRKYEEEHGVRLIPP